MYKIDAKGLVCPRPVILAKKALNEHEQIYIEVDNPTSRENLEKMAVVMNLTAATEQTGSIYGITLQKTEQTILNPETSEANYVLVLDTQIMGRGDDTLGAALMKSFLYALTESESLPETILCYNGGVKLTTTGSAVIPDLKVLESKGVEILSCGACLNHYGLTDALEVGAVTNMYVILEKQQSAVKTIRV